jgi:hypothetical protein
MLYWNTSEESNSWQKGKNKKGNRILLEEREGWKLCINQQI